MEPMNRRKFVRSAGTAAAAVAASGPFVRTGKAAGRSPNETINVAVIGIRSRGWQHAQNFAKIPNVVVKALCEPDENLFEERAADVESFTCHQARNPAP